MLSKVLKRCRNLFFCGLVFPLERLLLLLSNSSLSTTISSSHYTDIVRACLVHSPYPITLGFLFACFFLFYFFSIFTFPTRMKEEASLD